MNDEAEPLPPTTLPADLQLSLRGFDMESDLSKRFVNEMSEALIDCGRILNLERLAGVTVGYDFDEALASVDLGFESTRATAYTNNGDVICVAKAMNVIRNGRVMSHVVYNANFVEALIAPESEHHLQAIHIIAHELGHVAELKWRDDAIPNVILKPYKTDWVSAMLLEAGMAVWEEYAACRLTALFSDREAQKQTYAETYAAGAAKGLAAAQQRIKEYRLHGDVDKLLIEAGEPLAQPLKLAGYFLGHLDGLEDETDLDTMCPAHLGSVYQPFLPRLRHELRCLWDTRKEWAGMEVFDGLVLLVRELFSTSGIELQKQGEGHYVNVPFSAATMPEVDMLRAG